MNVESLATKTITQNDMVLNFTLVAHYGGICGQSNFDEQWKLVQNHVGGVNIKTDDGIFEPRQFTIPDLAKSYSQQNRPNPSKQAFDSAKQQLERDSLAFEVQLKVTVLKNGIELINDIITYSDYEHSDYNYDHDKMLNCLLEYAEENDFYFDSAKKIISQLTVAQC